MKKHPIYDVWFSEDGTAISSFGNRLTPQLVGKPPHKRFYLEVRKDGERINRSVARWLAETFIPNPLGLSDVDHIDNNGLNDVVSNLQWMTHQENVEKAWAKVYVVRDHIFGVDVEVYNLKKFAREHKVSIGSLRATNPNSSAVDKRNHCGGYSIIREINSP